MLKAPEQPEEDDNIDLGFGLDEYHEDALRKFFSDLFSLQPTQLLML